MGRGVARGGHGHRAHRPGRRPGGLRAGARARAPRALPGRRGGSLLRRVRLAARALHDGEQPTRSSAGSPRRASSSRRAATSTAIRTAGAATRRSSGASPTTGSSRVDELRQPLLDANATVEWTPAYMGKRMDDWLRNMGDWNISRRRYYGLPLPFYPCSCGQLTVIGSKAELFERATAPGRGSRGAPPSLDRRRSASAARRAAPRSSGSRRSATSGSTPASCRSRRSAGRAPSTSRRATRRALRRGSRPPICPTTRTGSSGFPRTGSRRCASRSGSGSTRSSSCPSR